MKANEDFIKETFRTNIQRIEDNSFTKKIVENHLTNKQVIRINPFANFLPLIIGVSFVIISIGFVLLIRQNNDWFSEISLSENHALIILILSVIFLIFKILEEFIEPNSGSTKSRLLMFFKLITIFKLH